MVPAVAYSDVVAVVEVPVEEAASYGGGVVHPSSSSSVVGGHVVGGHVVGGHVVEGSAHREEVRPSLVEVLEYHNANIQQSCHSCPTTSQNYVSYTHMKGLKIG